MCYNKSEIRKKKKFVKTTLFHTGGDIYHFENTCNCLDVKCHAPEIMIGRSYLSEVKLVTFKFSKQPLSKQFIMRSFFKKHQIAFTQLLFVFHSGIENRNTDDGDNEFQLR